MRRRARAMPRSSPPSPPAPSSLLGRAKVLKSAKKVNRNGQSDVHHHRRRSPVSSMTTTARRQFDRCRSRNCRLHSGVEILFPHRGAVRDAAAARVLRRCPFFTPPRSPSSSLSSSSSLPSSKSRVALRRRHRPRQMHPSVRLSVAVCREMEFMCDCGSQSQAAADKTSK